MYFKTPPVNFIDHPAMLDHMGGFEPRHIECIFLHATVGTNSLDWLTSTPNSRASVHRLIPKHGPIIKCVPDNIAAWTQGPACWFYPPHVKCNPNQVGLSIEFENLNDGKDPYTVEQVTNGVQQCIEWTGLYGFLPMVQHRMLQQDKSDPFGFPWALWNSLFTTHLRHVLQFGTWA